MKKNTAILIFANSAEKEAERKSFLSAEVFDALNKQTLKTVVKARIPYIHISEKQQIGNSFAERFTNAITHVFNQGFTNVITIGSDTPHLKTRHLKDTLQKLEKSELVLGPSKDGGFYLMGIKKEYFQQENFLKLPWQTNRLQSAITAIATAKKLEIQFLEVLQDIDSKEDIHQIIDSFKAISKIILKLLHAFLSPIKNSFSLRKRSILKIAFSKNFNKGSPQIFA